MAGLVVPAAWLLSGCGSPSGDLMTNVALPSQQVSGFVDGVGVTSSASQSGGVALTPAQHGYLDALAAAGIQPASELRALSIGSYVCQAHAAGHNDRAVRDYVAPMVRSDLADAHASTPQFPTVIQADAAITEYVRAATDKLC